MLKDWFESQTFYYVVAGLLGWTANSIYHIERKEMTWRQMLAAMGIAGMVAYITASVIEHFVPAMPFNLGASLCSIISGGCVYWWDRFGNFTKKVADKAEEVALDEK